MWESQSGHKDNGCGKLEDTVHDPDMITYKRQKRNNVLEKIITIVTVNSHILIRMECFIIIIIIFANEFLCVKTDY